MSLSSKEDRPKLKAKRFNKFESSSLFPKTERDDSESSSNIPKRGYKRINSDEENYSFKSKRICTTTILNTTPVVKNLANNRLQKLKEQIKTNSNAEGISNESGKEIPTKFIKINTDITPNYLRKNLAQERLKNLKTKLNDEDNCQGSTSPSNPDLQKSLDAEMKNSVTYEPLTETLEKNINEENVSDLVASSSQSFISKMERTAFWVKNHQDQTNYNRCKESNDRNLHEMSEQKQDTKIADGSDDMEWTNAEPDDEVFDPNEKESINETSKQEEEVKKIIKDPEKTKDVCIIVDTNVFIWALSKLRDIVNLKTSGSFKPIIYVPWMVITELDYMKDSCSDSKLLKSVVNAIKFINNALKDNCQRVVGQTVFDVEKQKHIGTSPDDKIIACCLQAAERYETVMLLSNDVNLKNKAMINNVPTCSANEIMIKLMSKLAKNTKYRKVMNKMGIMCSSVICECMKTAYGNVWLRMDLMSSPPWSLAECLKRFKKYWSAVFREKLMKQFTKTLQDLQNIINETNQCISDDSEEFVEFVKLCVTLCIFLKDIDECRGFVENTLTQITKTA